MYKRGIRHIDVILSFVLFIGAAGFALWFFSPGDSSRLIDTSIDYGFREIFENTSIELAILSIRINNSTIPVGTEIIAINVSGVNSNFKTRVKTDGKIVLNSTRIGDLVFIKSSNWTEIKFIIIELCEDFKEDLGVSPVFHYRDYYEITSIESNKVISEERFLDLTNLYYDNYALIRDGFNIHVGFGFSLVFGDESLVAEQEIPGGLEVFSEKRRAEVLRSKGDKTEFADLVIKVW